MSDLSANKNSSLFGCVSFAFHPGRDRSQAPVIRIRRARLCVARSFIFPPLSLRSSTTQTVTGSVIGVGAARKVSAVRWNIATNIVILLLLRNVAALDSGD